MTSHNDTVKYVTRLLTLICTCLLFVGYSIDRPVMAANQRYIDIVFSDVKVKQELNYGASTLDLYQPDRDTLSKRPVIILVHGGGFVSGSKELWDGPAKQLAKRGYVALAINYPLSSSSNTPGTFSNSFPYEPINKAREATLAAVRWARANATTYKLDPDRIAVLGNSAGAVTALYAAYDTDIIANTSNSQFSSRISAAVSNAGGMKASDIPKIGKNDPPSLIFHGLNDGIVPVSTSKQVDAKLTELGIPHEAYYYPGVQHNVTSVPDVMPKTLDFLFKYVVNAATPTTPPVTTTVPPATTTAPPTTTVPPSTSTPSVTTTQPPSGSGTPTITHTPSDTGFNDDPLLYIGGFLYAVGVIAFVGARVIGTKKSKR